MSVHVKHSTRPVLPLPGEPGNHPYTEEEVLELAESYHQDGDRLHCCFHQDATLIPVADALAAKGLLRFIRIRNVKVDKTWYQAERIYAITPAGRRMAQQAHH